jgi:tetrahydromethanopterin S-methyltransferase subunit B
MFSFQTSGRTYVNFCTSSGANAHYAYTVGLIYVALLALADGIIRQVDTSPSSQLIYYNIKI